MVYSLWACATYVSQCSNGHLPLQPIMSVSSNNMGHVVAVFVERFTWHHPRTGACQSKFHALEDAVHASNLDTFWIDAVHPAHEEHSNNLEAFQRMHLDRKYIVIGAHKPAFDEKREQHADRPFICKTESFSWNEAFLGMMIVAIPSMRS